MATRKTVEEKLQEAEAKAKQAKAKVMQLKALQRKQQAKEREAEGKRRREEEKNFKIRLGGLVILAKLGEDDKGFILGALLDAAQKKGDQQQYSRLKAMGDALLAKQAAENRHSAAAQAQG